MVNASPRTCIAVLHARPIAHTWKFDGRVREVEKFTRQLGRHLTVLAPDQVPPTVNRSHPGESKIVPAPFDGFVREPAIQTKFTEFHLAADSVE